MAGFWWFLTQSTANAVQVAYLNDLELRISTLETEIKEGNRINQKIRENGLSVYENAQMKYRIYYRDDILISKIGFAPDDHRAATNIYDLDEKWIAQFKAENRELLSKTSTVNSNEDFLYFDMVSTGKTAYLGGVLGNVYVSEGVSMSDMETCGANCWPSFVGVVVQFQNIQYTMMFYDIEPEELNEQPYADLLKSIEFIKSE